MIAALLLNRYTLSAAAGLAIAASAWAYRASIISTADAAGYSRAVAELHAAQADRLREQARETTRLIGVIQEAQQAYNTQTASVAEFRDRARTAERRVRDQSRELDARIAAASASSLRAFAQATGANLDRCRADVERFASEAANCSATAHALDAAREALAR